VARNLAIPVGKDLRSVVLLNVEKKLTMKYIILKKMFFAKYVEKHLRLIKGNTIKPNIAVGNVG